MNSDDSGDAYFVVANDGTPFRCHIERTAGALASPTDIWIFTMIDGRRFVGPAVVRPATSAIARDVLTAWWQDRQRSPYANVTAETMRAKLRDQDN